MRDKGKAVVKNTTSSNHHYSSTTDLFFCRKHPSSSSVGICAQCLRDRLMKLVCSDCGEQRLSSCSCSDEILSNRNSCAVDVGSVGRVSFLIENDKAIPDLSLFTPNRKSESRSGVDSLERDRIFAPDVNRRSHAKGGGGLLRFKRLFWKKRCDDDGKNEMWFIPRGLVSRSRSLCSFRREGDLNLDARSSCVVDMDLQEKTRISKVDLGLDLSGANRRVFSLREGENTGGFIDLKFRPKSMVSARSNSYCTFSDRGGGGAGNRRFSFDGDGGSCKARVNDKSVGRSGKGGKVWRWFFRAKS